MGERSVTIGRDAIGSGDRNVGAPSGQRITLSAPRSAVACACG
jgi:hypothetical protein